MYMPVMNSQTQYIDGLYINNSQTQHIDGLYIISIIHKLNTLMGIISY